MYAGLTISDKPALLNAKQAGHKEYGVWLEEKNGWKRMVTVNIDLALAQIAEMEKTPVLVECYTDPIAPPTHKSVLLERWAKDTRELAKLFVDSRYDAIIRAYTTQDGSLCWEYDDALEAEIAYLNSAAEGATK